MSRDHLGRFSKADLLDPTRVVDPGLQQNPSPFKSVGAPGAVIYSGFLLEREKDNRLTGRQKYITYSDILANTSIVSAGTRFFLNLVSKAGWKVEPADESSEAEKIAENVKTIMHDMTTPWHRVVRRAAMSRFWGFSVQEWTAVRREDGMVGFLDIEPRAQSTIERWDSDMSGTVLGIIQRRPQDGKDIYLPRNKTIYMVDDTLDDGPEGMGLFRHLAKTVHALERFEILESWAFERDLRGTPIARGPLTEIQRQVNAGSLSPADAALLKKPFEDFIEKALRGKDTGMFIESAVYRGTGDNNTPSNARQWDVELMQGGGQGHEAIAAAIERKNREIARVLGVEHLLLGSDSSGSFAMSQDKTKSFGLIVDSTLREIKETFEADFLDPLFLLNGWDEKLKPTFVIEQIQYRDIEQITAALADLARAGAPLVNNDPAINEVRAQIGLSDQPEQEDIDLSAMTQPGLFGGEGEDEIPEEEDEGNPGGKEKGNPGGKKEKA